MAMSEHLSITRSFAASATAARSVRTGARFNCTPPVANANQNASSSWPNAHPQRLSHRHADHLPRATSGSHKIERSAKNITLFCVANADVLRIGCDDRCPLAILLTIVG
jgi:hypothetical protein